MWYGSVMVWGESQPTLDARAKPVCPPEESLRDVSQSKIRASLLKVTDRRPVSEFYSWALTRGIGNSTILHRALVTSRYVMDGI